MNDKSLDEARSAKPKALAEFEKQVKVIGVGITRVGEGYGLKVNLQDHPRPGADLPETVEGVPVRVEVVRTIRKG